jgi:predicted RNase H-related nuclease YkuK (DUF458 family)
MSTIKKEVEKEATSSKTETTKRIWKDPDNHVFGEDEKLLTWIKNHPKEDKFGNPVELAIGTDSHIHGHYFKFPSVVCLYEKGKGGMYYFTTSYEHRKHFKGQQQIRMFQEVQKSVELAAWIEEQTGWKPEIHIDASPAGSGHFTAPYSDSLKGYATGYGFKAFVKPMSWCANAISDRHSKS